MTSMRTPVDVAAGVLIRHDGRFLLASRPAGKPYASYWEFPGGKVEASEAIAYALARELHEELGIEIGTAYPWVVRAFDYPHALVRLHFFRVFEWSGELRAREHQSFGFFSTIDLPIGPLLPATVPVLRWLALAPFYAISAAAQLGRALFLRRLDAALERGLKLIQFREPTLDGADANELFDDVLARVRVAGGTLLVNSRHPRSLWGKADGVHLTAADLAASETRPQLEWVAASVHSPAEIERAADLQLDFVAAAPVLATLTHPDLSPLGWEAFARIAAKSSVPVYALGGMHASDLVSAMRHGAHGIASLSSVWNEDQCERRLDAFDALFSLPLASPPPTSLSSLPVIE
ncbi:MAG TPA: Nudix family hydrolase [Burkholderiaceae bacterium]|nr:Nudix family hydrolase [Burkholderiaceae bacterium]